MRLRERSLQCNVTRKSIKKHQKALKNHSMKMDSCLIEMIP